MRLGTALVLSAPSGAGKTTLVRKLLSDYPDFGYSVSCTTRKPRPGEVDGRDYHFLSRDDFLKQREEGAFAEWAVVHGNFYGTPMKPLQALFASGQDVLLDVDVQGAAQLKLSIESEMHRRIYLEREDVGAVVHSHPLYASMFSALEEKIDTKLLAESYYLLLDVCKAPYALMGTSELAQNVAMTIRKCNAMLLENHGALTVGRSLLQAFERMEVLENAAKLTYMTGKSFTVSHISEENLEIIRKNFC